MKKKPHLGSRQERVLVAMCRGKGNVWHGGCGWVYGSPSETAKILEALARRGLVTKTHGLFDGWTYGRFELSEQGRQYIIDNCPATAAAARIGPAFAEVVQ